MKEEKMSIEKQRDLWRCVAVIALCALLIVVALYAAGIGWKSSASAKTKTGPLSLWNQGYGAKQSLIDYDNYYGITKESDPKRYDVIVDNVLLPMLNSVIGNACVDPKTADLSVYAVQFLQNAGMTEAQIAALKAALTE